MKSLLFVLLAAGAFAAGAFTAHAEPPILSEESLQPASAEDGEPMRERWDFTFGKKPWQLASAGLNGTAVIRTYVPKGRSLANTNERLITEYGSMGDPHKLFDQMKLGLVQACPDLEILPISEEEDAVLFEWTCGGSLAQHSLKKIQRQGEEIHVITYSRKGKMRAKAKKTWLAILEAAKPK